MKRSFPALSLGAALLVAGSLTASFAQDVNDTMPAHPRFARLLPHLNNDSKTPATPLTTWNGSFVYKGRTYNYNMVGTAPTTGKSTTIQTFIIPIALSYKTKTGTTIFTPETTLSNGLTPVTSTTSSPIFKSMNWVTPKGTSLGTTQYEDAFQRGNFWSEVSAAPGYHVLLATPKVLPLQTISVPPADGVVSTEFGVTVGTADINWFDGKIEAIMTQNKQITPNSFPIFITSNVYLTEGECCIGGYHSSYGSSSAPQAYGMFTYITTPGIFAQDVSALSHEAGEWLDDPLVVNTNGNPVSCGILEVGDPEEGFSEDGATYGAFPYVFNGNTYNLQDLTYLEYFGAPNTTSVDGGAETFHDNPFGLGICNNGG